MQLIEQAGLLPLQSRDLVSRHRPELVVAVRPVAQLSRTGQFLAGRLQRPEGRNGRLEAGQLAAKAAELVGVGRDLGEGQLGLQVVVLRRDLGQLGVEVAHDTAGGSSGLVAMTGSPASGA